MNRPTVVILSTNRSFAREVAAHWPKDSGLPEFTILEERLFRDLAGHYHLVVADASEPDSQLELRKALAAAGKPAILIHADPALPIARIEESIIELRGQDGLWPALTGILGREILSRSFAESRQRRAEAVCASLDAEATLGRYIVETRHNINNALTTVLGNAELLTLEPKMPARVLVDAEAIRDMALRLNEIFKRFSSLEKELSVAARESDKKGSKAHAAAGGR